MPSFISKGGIWEPAQERAVVGEKGKEEIYVGPDRAAMEVLKAEGVTHLGQDFHNDPEMIMRARQLGYKTVDEYLTMYNYSKAEADKAYEKAKAQVITHETPSKKAPVVVQSGGDDTSGMGKSAKGGFGVPEQLGGGE